MKYQFSKSKFFGEHLITQVEQNPQSLALADSELSVNYLQLTNDVFKISNLFYRLGMKAKDRVIVSLGNKVLQMYYHYGVILGGGVCVPLPMNLNDKRLSYHQEDTESTMTIKPSGIYDNQGTKISDLKDYKSCDKKISPQPLDQLASIMYTTGSTKYPKGVMLSQQTLISSLTHILQYLKYDGHERELVLLPISHSFALGHVYSNNIVGGFVYLEEGMLKIKRVFKALLDYQITGMPSTPTMLELLMSRYKERFLPLANKMEYLVVNSAPLPSPLATEIIKELPQINLHVYYGLTEASRSTFITLSNESSDLYESVGPASPRVKIKIENEEVCIKGPHLFSGYWKQPEETKKSIRKGWFHTGDLGSIDPNGYLTITGRIKDFINVGGLKVSPQEIESAILSLKWVSDVAVVGLDDVSGLKGQIVGVLVTLAIGIKIDEKKYIKKIRDECVKHLEPHMLPEKIKFTSQIPRAESGKVLREEVKNCLL